MRSGLQLCALQKVTASLGLRLGTQLPYTQSFEKFPMSEVLGRELAQPRAPQVASPIRLSQGHHCVPVTRLRGWKPGSGPQELYRFSEQTTSRLAGATPGTRLLLPSWETGWLLCPFLW